MESNSLLILKQTTLCVYTHIYTHFSICVCVYTLYTETHSYNFKNTISSKDK